MKMPKMPPGDIEITDSEQTKKIFRAVVSATSDGRYLHWDKLIRHQPPAGLDHEEWWWGIKVKRRLLAREIPLVDCHSRNFTYNLVDPLPESLHTIDQGAGGFIQMEEQIANSDRKDQYYVNSLIQEAITSSQLEGAVTTRQIASAMIRADRKPIDRSEKMVLNNFHTMKMLQKLKHQPLTPGTVFHIHLQVTAGTLDDPTAEGRLRREDEDVVVDDHYGEIFHRPPPANELEYRVQAMCDFANGKTPEGQFVHPIIRSIILHFWLAYDHPFVDGNGRTARALFYWSMLHHGYWLFEFISISQIILRGPAKYSRAFLYTETDENDLTYFLLYHAEVIRQAIDELHDYIARKTDRIQQLEAELRGTRDLNHRQRDLISHALRHPHAVYTIDSHRTSHGVVYQTARADLLDLVERGLLLGRKKGRAWSFRPAKDLEATLAGAE